MAELIKPSDLYQTLGTENSPVILDVRDRQEYKEGHLPEALNIPLTELIQRLAEIPKDRLAVPYCNMRHRGNSRGEKAAELLTENGFQAQAIDGGFIEWGSLGLPVKKD